MLFHVEGHLISLKDAFFQAPILRENGEQLSHEEVVAQLNADTLSSSSTLGRHGRSFTGGTFAQAVMLNLQSEVSYSLSNARAHIKMSHFYEDR